MTITFIGHGYVGLVTACVFADFGNDVWVIGHTKEKISKLQKGDPLIFEPGLRESLEKNLKNGRIRFTLDYSKAIPASDIVFTAVGTPPKENGEANLSIVLSVAKQIAKYVKKGFTVISCKSTVPVGTNKKVENIINTFKYKEAEIAVASCPEFLREGTALSDTLNPDRVVIGSDSQKAIQLLIELHTPIGGKRIITDLASAELIKYTSNAMLATKISFANLISFYCEKTGADVETVLESVGLDHRIGREFFNPGVGYGGSCLPKDVKAMIKTGHSLKIDTELLEAVEKINEQTRINFLNKILTYMKGNKITIWGLSFKPNTDDIRFAPSLLLIQKLLKKKKQICVYDPEAMNNVKSIFRNAISYAANPYSALKNSCALCILTEWNEFKQIDLHKVKLLLQYPMVFDGRNIYDPKKMKELGFSYFGIGRNV